MEGWDTFYGISFAWNKWDDWDDSDCSMDLGGWDYERMIGFGNPLRGFRV